MEVEPPPPPHEPMPMENNPGAPLVALVENPAPVEMTAPPQQQNAPVSGPHASITTLAPISVGMSMPYTVGPYSFAVQGLPHPHAHHAFHPRTVTLGPPPNAPPPHLHMYHIPTPPPQFLGPNGSPNLQYYSAATVSLAPNAPSTPPQAVQMRPGGNPGTPPHHHMYPISIQPPPTMQVFFIIYFIPTIIFCN